MSPYPYGMCEADASLYDEDIDPSEMQHEECATVAQQRDDQLAARASRDWLTTLAPYCGTAVADSDCPDRPGRWHMCVARPDHERGQTQHHVCDCGYSWTESPRG